MIFKARNHKSRLGESDMAILEMESFISDGV